MHPGTASEGAKGQSCLLLSAFWSKKVGAASALSPVRGIAHSGHYSHLKKISLETFFHFYEMFSIHLMDDDEVDL